MLVINYSSIKYEIEAGKNFESYDGVKDRIQRETRDRILEILRAEPKHETYDDIKLLSDYLEELIECSYFSKDTFTLEDHIKCQAYGEIKYILDNFGNFKVKRLKQYEHLERINGDE